MKLQQLKENVGSTVLAVVVQDDAQAANGTSFQGVVSTDIDTLTQLFGEPKIYYPDHKIDVTWTLEFRFRDMLGSYDESDEDDHERAVVVVYAIVHSAATGYDDRFALAAANDVTQWKIGAKSKAHYHMAAEFLSNPNASIVQHD